MKKIYVLYVCLFLSVSSLFSQEYRFSGTLSDSATLKPLSGATISLINIADTNNKYFSISDNNGYFRIINCKHGDYRFSISYIGYHTKNGKTTISNKNIDIGNINLIPAILNLTEVQVTADAIAVQHIGDTIQYNAQSYKTNPDANAENLLEKMPGMVMENGKMQAQGEDVKQVLVDGNPFFGDDQNAALKNIPAEIIDKIQVFDQQSEQSKFTGFDDGNTIKTINIITKPEYRNGTFGNVYAGYGYDEKYSLGGVTNIFRGNRRITILGQSNNINLQNFSADDLAGVMSSSGGGRGRRGGGGKGGGRPGRGSGSAGDINDFLIGEQGGITSTNAFGINYTDKMGEKVQLTASYFFNQSKNISNVLLSQNYFSNTTEGQEYSEAETSESENINHRFNLKLDYDINKNNSILINPKFTLQSNNGFSDLLGKTMFSDTLLNSTVNNFQSDVNVWSFSNFIMWRHRFNKRGRSFMLNLSQNLKNNVAESFLESQSNFYTTSQFDTTDQNADLDQFEQTYSVRMVYNEPLSRKLNMQFDYMSSYNFSDSQKETYNYDPVNVSYSILDTALSNIAESNYLTNALGVGIRYNNGRSMLMLNCSFQHAELNVDHVLPSVSNTNNKYKSILPTAMWRYNISQNKNLRLFYRSNTLNPTISQLQEVLDNSNPLQLTMGNANLDQQEQHSLFVKYSSTNTDKNSIFFAMLSGSYINDYIANHTTIAYNETTTSEGITLPPGSQLIRPENLDGYYNFRGFVTYGMLVSKLKSNLNINITANFRRIPGIINGNLNLVNTPTFGVGAGLSSNISEKLDFTINSSSTINYTFNTMNANMNTQYFSQATKLRLYWSFWKDITFRTELLHQFYSGLSGDFDTNYLLWNMSLGSRLFRNKRGELLLSVYDILNQNKSITQISTETYIQETLTEVLNTYIMITFRYSFTKFKSS